MSLLVAFSPLLRSMNAPLASHQFLHQSLFGYLPPFITHLPPHLLSLPLSLSLSNFFSHNLLIYLYLLILLLFFIF